MKVSDRLVLQRLFVCASLAVLAACNGVSQFGPLGDARQESLTLSLRTKDFKTIYTFGYFPDGNRPVAGLIAKNGIFYGTTNGGGSGFCVYSGINYGCGTVFSVTPAGQEHVVYSFKGGGDGASPAAAPFALNGLLYGTTSGGGKTGCGGCGTVYSVTTTGQEKVLHRFQGVPDGNHPNANLIAEKRILYGTTFWGGCGNCHYNHCHYGGAYGCGTIFSISTSGKERVLYAFQGAPSDGAMPLAGLVAVNHVLYGTTTEGGGSASCYDGCGTVFSVTTSGGERVIYAFKGGTDGSTPWTAGLVALNGVLYGTTFSGGAYGNGTVFSVTTSGGEKVLYQFKGGSDGENPADGLTVMNGLLYGTTQNGGAYGNGTIFSVTTAGQEKVLHAFKGTTDGGSPNGLISLNKVFYGTTYGSGNGPAQRGTVFRLSP